MHFINIKDLTDGYKNFQNDFIMSNEFNILKSVPDLSEKGKLSVIISRPGMGKTTFMLQAALNLSLQNIPCYVFSLEMSKEHLLKQILKVITDVQILNHLPINICDNVLYIEDIKRIIKDKIKDGVVFIDCSDLILPPDNNENINILKQTAEDNRNPIVVTSQLSKKEYESLKSGKCPNFTFEDRADNIIFLYREPFLLEDLTENKNADNVYVKTLKSKAKKPHTEILKWNSEKYCFTPKQK